MDIYQLITDRIIKKLEEGTVPWQQPWRSTDARPRNLVSGKEYRGINALVLASAGYESPYWLTFRQAKDRGGHVKREEHGYPCIYWNSVEIKDRTTSEKKMIRLLRYYTVFNSEQCENIHAPSADRLNNIPWSTAKCQQVMNAMHNRPNMGEADTAFYRPSIDTIFMPSVSRFSAVEEYYSTLFHELVHSTGHASRLARPGITDEILFGSDRYSKEELIAEMGGAFLCGHTGIENRVIDNTASYIDSWLRHLKSDSRLVVLASSQAQMASDYILNHTSSWGLASAHS